MNRADIGSAPALLRVNLHTPQAQSGLSRIPLNAAEPPNPLATAAIRRRWCQGLPTDKGIGISVSCQFFMMLNLS